MEKKEKEYVKSNEDTEDVEIKENCAETKENVDGMSFDTNRHVEVVSDGKTSLQSVKKSEKHVSFKFIPEDEEEEISDDFQIDVSVGDFVNRVILMGIEMDIKKAEQHRIDDFYVNFASSQSRAGEIIQKLQDEDTENNKYSPELEDITDDETKKIKIVYRKKAQVMFKVTKCRAVIM